MKFVKKFGMMQSINCNDTLHHSNGKRHIGTINL